MLAFDRGGSYTTQTYTRYVTASGGQRQTALIGTTLVLEGGVLLDFIAANGAGVASATDENDLSLAVHVRYGEFDAVFAGESCVGTVRCTSNRYGRWHHT